MCLKILKMTFKGIQFLTQEKTPRSSGKVCEIVLFLTFCHIPNSQAPNFPGSHRISSFPEEGGSVVPSSVAKKVLGMATWSPWSCGFPGVFGTLRSSHGVAPIVFFCAESFVLRSHLRDESPQSPGWSVAVHVLRNWI